MCTFAICIAMKLIQDNIFVFEMNKRGETRAIFRYILFIWFYFYNVSIRWHLCKFLTANRIRIILYVHSLTVCIGLVACNFNLQEESTSSSLLLFMMMFFFCVFVSLFVFAFIYLYLLRHTYDYILYIWIRQITLLQGIQISHKFIDFCTMMH